MDEGRKQVLLAELEDAKAERADLDAFIQVLSARLGIETSGDDHVPVTTPAGPGQLPVSADPLDLVYANEFVGFSFPKAAETVLSRWSPAPHQRPLKTTQLVAALRKGGLDVKDSRQVYRALWNATRFHNLKGGAWGFAAWYPASVLNKSKNAEHHQDDDPEVAQNDTVPDDLSSLDAEGTTPVEVAQP